MSQSPIENLMTEAVLRTARSYLKYERKAELASAQVGHLLSSEKHGIRAAALELALKSQSSHNLNVAARIVNDPYFDPSQSL
jgi:hypothetical protein